MSGAARMVPRARVVRYGEPGASWEIATRPPSPSLQPFVRELYGYIERSTGLQRRREFPIPGIVVIFELGPPIRVFDAGDAADGPNARQRTMRFPGGFVAGLDDRFTIIEHDSWQSGVQVNLTPAGARAVFGLPMSELAGRVVPVADLLPRGHRSFTDRLASLPDWDARFALVERLICDRVTRTPDLHRPTMWAYAEIVRRGGALEIARLARELGYSQAYLIKLFRDQVGLPPKRVARLMRFDRMMHHLKTGGAGTWAELAVTFGYYDQAHLVRDVRAFTGLTPTAARASLINLA